MEEKSSTSERVGQSANAMRIRSLRTGAIIAGRVRIASSLPALLRGLIGEPRLRPGDALWLDRCNGIHTFGMRHAIAVVTLRKDGTVVAIHHNVAPCRVIGPVRGGAITVEMLPETLDSGDIRIGDRLALETSP